jgi:hypothetical protein
MNVEDTVSIIGIHTFKTFDTRNGQAQSIENAIIALADEYPLCVTDHQKSAHRARYKELTTFLEPYILEEKQVKNLVATVGRSVIAQRLANTTTYTGIINYGVLGSSSTAVTNADTQLGTEVFRKVVASASFTTNAAFMDFFYSKADTNGTYNEFGTFIDGSAGANTGQLFTHVLTGGWVKSSSVSMTISCQYTFN